MFRSSYDRAYFNSVLYRTSASSPRNARRLRLILARRPGGVLLEIGCGKGHLLQVARAHFEVEGLEVSEAAIQGVEEELRQRIRIGDVQREDLPEGRYDVVAAFNVLEHLASPAGALAHIRAALRPEGILVGSVPLNHSLIGRAHTALTNIFDRTHCSTLTLAQWRCLFAGAGFADQELFGEIQAGPNRAVYVRGRLWPHVSLNLMFVLRQATSAAQQPAA
jgi:2-polyprenyl-3-methyl-5-hydroxy-6-metoxy-1,4-benzoquinol methylase